MKNLLTAVSAFAFAGMALADGIDTTQFGILAVPSSAAETIVAVPWLASGTGTDSVKVADLVLTDNLTVGDELKWYDSATRKYQNWILREKEESDKTVKYWASAINVSGDAAKTSEDATKQGIERGQALILKRQSPIADTFYIKGKPTSDAAQTMTISSASGVYSLIAPPSLTNTLVNSLKWSGLKAGKDSLITTDSTGAFKSYIWSGKRWRSTGTDGAVNDLEVIKGTGVWFLSGSDDTKTVTW